jgi:hypothetical protein
LSSLLFSSLPFPSIFFSSIPFPSLSFTSCPLQLLLPILSTHYPFSYAFYMPSTFLCLITLIIFREQYKLWSSLRNLLHPALTACIIGPSALLSTLFSNTDSINFFLRMRYQISPACGTGKIRVLYSTIFTFLC